MRERRAIRDFNRAHTATEREPFRRVRWLFWRNNTSGSTKATCRHKGTTYTRGWPFVTSGARFPGVHRASYLFARGCGGPRQNPLACWSPSWDKKTEGRALVKGEEAMESFFTPWTLFRPKGTYCVRVVRSNLAFFFSFTAIILRKHIGNYNFSEIRRIL